MQTHAQLLTAISYLLQDTSNVLFTAAELPYIMTWARREISRYVPYWRTALLPMESRTGTATSTTTSALVDATEAQFLSTDVDKVIYNSTDKTWAIVTAYSSTSQLTLSKNIMASGENYKMFNRYVDDPVNGQKMVDISQLTDWLRIESAEYPLGYKRNVEIQDSKRLLRIIMDRGVDDTDLDDADSERYTRLHMATVHRLPAITDYAGEVNNAAGYAAETTTIAVDGFGNSEVIPEHSLLTFEEASKNIRGTYEVSESLTLSGTGTGNLKIYPGLLDAVVDDANITIVPSTLTENLEEIFIDLAASRVALSKSRSSVSKAADLMAWWTAIRDGAYRELNSLQDMTPSKLYPRW